MMNCYVRITDDKDNSTVKEFGPMNKHKAEKLEMSLYNRIDIDNFSIELEQGQDNA